MCSGFWLFVLSLTHPATVFIAGGGRQREDFATDPVANERVKLHDSVPPIILLVLALSCCSWSLTTSPTRPQQRPMSVDGGEVQAFVVGSAAVGWSPCWGGIPNDRRIICEPTADDKHSNTSSQRWRLLRPSLGGWRTGGRISTSNRWRHIATVTTIRSWASDENNDDTGVIRWQQQQCNSGCDAAPVRQRKPRGKRSSRHRLWGSDLWPNPDSATAKYLDVHPLWKCGYCNYPLVGSGFSPADGPLGTKNAVVVVVVIVVVD